MENKFYFDPEPPYGGMFPEQYVIYHGDKPVGYCSLDGGIFSVWATDEKGDPDLKLWTMYPEGIHQFTDDERIDHLNKALDVVRLWITNGIHHWPGMIPVPFAAKKVIKQSVRSDGQQRELVGQTILVLVTAERMLSQVTDQNDDKYPDDYDDFEILLRCLIALQGRLIKLLTLLEYNDDYVDDDHTTSIDDLRYNIALVKEVIDYIDIKRDMTKHGLQN